MPLQLRSELRSAAKQMCVHLREAAIPTPKNPHDLIVRVEAAPVNPSDFYNVFGPSDFTAAPDATPENGLPSLKFSVPEKVLPAFSYRFDIAEPCGNECAGVVVAAGDAPEAQALIGKTVAVLTGSCYAEYTKATLKQCIPLPDGATAEDGASSFVNPLTALGFVETMKLEGHKAIVHTAAASNLGQMLVKICGADGIDLVNVVRRDEQAQLLRDLGAKYVVNSSSPTFQQDLVDAIAVSGATLGFDATGGGTLTSDILNAMEKGIVKRGDAPAGRYGSDILKQVYIYGGLDSRPTTLNRGFGMTWGVGGWLLFPFLKKAGPATAGRMFQRVGAELKTTFASSYTGRLTLPEFLLPANVAKFGKMATGEKYLLTPQRK